MGKEFLVLLLSLSLVLAGCTSDDSSKESSSDGEYVEEVEVFPEWDELTDDGTNWSSTKQMVRHTSWFSLHNGATVHVST